MRDKQIDMFEDPNIEDQIKLATLTVYNWGSFNGLHSININPDGTLITGENGAGKSTIIDGLMVLLCSAGRVSFNMAAAQGDKSDRSLVSYMRGSFGRFEDESGSSAKNLRNGTVATVLKATYKHTASDRIVVLLGVFYINGSSNQLSDVKKIYVISESDISVKEALNHFSNNDTHSLKAYLKTFNRCYVCDDNFKEYEAHYKNLLNIENSNAPALLSRALGLKKIDDLTELIRKLVLEPGEIKQDAMNTVKQFDDLKTTHQKLLDARKQEAELVPLRDTHIEYQRTVEKRALFDEARSELDCFVSGYAIEHYEKEMKDFNSEMEVATLKKKELEDKKTELENYQNLCHENYLKQGGDAIEKISYQISNTKSNLSRVSDDLRRYNDLTRKLNLKDGSSEENFTENFKKYAQLLEDYDKLESELFDQRAKIVSESKNLDGKIKDITQEIRLLEDKSDSNVDYHYQRVRDEIIQDLDIDPSELVFAAELMDVKEEEARWQGAIERALGGIRLTLLVSQHFYRGITTWVNQRHTGLHIRIQVVEPDTDYSVSFGNRGYLQKLKWKKHPFTNWLQNHLLKHDLACVDSVEEMNDTEFSMTVEGLIHRKGGFFEKKDLRSINDRHDWFLGFSSKDKLNLLKREQNFLSSQLIELQSKDLKLLQKKREYDELNTNIVLLNEFKQFSQIDTQSLEKELAALEEQQNLIQTSPDTLRLKDIWEESKKAVYQANQDIYLFVGQIATIQTRIENCENKLKKYRELNHGNISREIEEIILNIFKKGHVTVSACFEDREMEKTATAFKFEIDSLDAKVKSLFASERGSMGEFYSAWADQKGYENLTRDNVEGYLDLLDKIQKEGLPALVEEFKEKLNTEVTQSVASIKSKIDAEIASIEERIGMINEVLARAEFRENSYLKIVAKKVKYPFITEFERDVDKVMGMLLSDDHEKRFEALEKVINTLNVAIKNSNTKDNMRLLDPRLRMFFVAQELDRKTNEIRDVLDSSSGKSGGEKEAFAGSVVAAALAYVLTPADESVPSYSTVFLDEAFSNTSDAVSIRVLRIFKELKLHVNLITPFKNIDVARDYARSLIIMTRDVSSHNSMASELTWEEYDEQLNAARSRELEELGIRVDEQQ